eukprot:10751271-Ditylum_brightwellii.AAC.1
MDGTINYKNETMAELMSTVHSLLPQEQIPPNTEKNKDIRTYMKDSKKTQLPKIYTSNKKIHKKKIIQKRQQENTINNYLQYHTKYKAPKSRTQQPRKKAGSNNGVTDYYTNQRRPLDMAKQTQTTLREYKFKCHPN